MKSYVKNKLVFKKTDFALTISPHPIIEWPSIEWQSTLYIKFTAFERVFDGADRDVIWMLMHTYGIFVLNNIITCIHIFTVEPR